jgi:hypothetical protein
MAEEHVERRDEALPLGASTAESTFYLAVAAAEGARQAAYGAAWATWLANATAANKAAFMTSIAAADVAYFTAVNTARNASGLTLKTIGDIGPIPWSWSASLGSSI